MITTTQAAAILDKHPATVWRMARDQRIPSIRVGNRYRFDELTLRVIVAADKVRQA
jgi:excisionase family DNA binding protein